MEFKLESGMTYTATQSVELKDTAAKYGSGLVEVLLHLQ